MRSLSILCLIILSGIVQTSWAKSTEPKNIYPYVIVGGGAGGLNLAYNRLTKREPCMVFTLDVGGPIMHGGLPETWKGRPSWKYKVRQQTIAHQLGCSTKAENETQLKQQILCFVNGMIKAIGPEHIHSNYELIKVKTKLDSEAPIELIFRVAGSPQLKTVYANNVEFAIPPSALKKVKFVKAKKD